MELNKQLEFCKICTKRKFSDIGIVCSLTNAKPTFDSKCDDFLIDPKEEQKAKAREKYKDYNDEGGSKTSIWTYVFVAFVVIKIVVRLLRD